jgi:hypothetical protein
VDADLIIERTGGPEKRRPETEVCLDRFERTCQSIRIQVHHFAVAESGPHRGQRKMKEIRQQQTYAGRVQYAEFVLVGTGNFDNLRRHCAEGYRTYQ